MQPAPAAPPAAPTAPSLPQTPTSVAPTAAPTAAQMLDAAKAVRQVLERQLDAMRSRRNRITSELTNDETQGADRLGLEARLKTVDARIAELDKALATAEVQEVQAAGQPGAVVPPPPYRYDWRNHIDDFLAGGALLSFALLFPLAIAYSRRIWRRSANVTVTLPPDVASRMQAMEEAIESVAVEVERIGEGQRFMTQALADSPRHLGAGAAEPVMVRPREAMKAAVPAQGAG